MTLSPIKILLISLVCVFSFGQVNYLSPIFSHVFSFPNSRWDFMMDQEKYGVEIAGFLKGTNWETSPVIIYSEVIYSNYYFDLYNTLMVSKKTTQYKTIRHRQKQLLLDTKIPYTITFWVLPNIVFEYVTYFSIDKNHIVSIVMSSKNRKHIEKHFNDYKEILRNFARTASSLKK